MRSKVEKWKSPSNKKPKKSLTQELGFRVYQSISIPPVLTAGLKSAVGYNLVGQTIFLRPLRQRNEKV